MYNDSEDNKDEACVTSSRPLYDGSSMGGKIDEQKGKEEMVRAEGGGPKFGYWNPKRMINYVNEGEWAASPLKIPGTQDWTAYSLPEAVAWVEVDEVYFENS